MRMRNNNLSSKNLNKELLVLSRNIKGSQWNQPQKLTPKLLEQADVLMRTAFGQINQLRQEQLLEKNHIIQKLQQEEALYKQQFNLQSTIINYLQNNINDNNELIECVKDIFQLIWENKYTKNSLLEHCKTQPSYFKHFEKLQALFCDNNKNIATNSQKSASTTPILTPIQSQKQEEDQLKHE